MALPNGVDLYLHTRGVDTTTPVGRALYQMLGVFAEFERSIIQERIHAGGARARARAQGWAVRPR
jgi:DNA invertase Pin-like site-specific DNA recombinase